MGFYDSTFKEASITLFKCPGAIQTEDLGKRLSAGDLTDLIPSHQEKTPSVIWPNTSLRVKPYFLNYLGYRVTGSSSHFVKKCIEAASAPRLDPRQGKAFSDPHLSSF